MSTTEELSRRVLARLESCLGAGATPAAHRAPIGQGERIERASAMSK